MKTLVIVSACLAVSACDRHQNTAPSGGSPAVATPVGPIPGPGEESTASANPFGDDPVALVEGRRLFVQYNCAGCHGDHAGGGMGPSLRDKDWIYGDSDVHIFDSIAEGRAHGMPSWAVRMPEQQVWKIVSYIKSLRTDKEPERPE
jgi:cytochrome c oxidase cbb3-type subunit III